MNRCGFSFERRRFRALSVERPCRELRRLLRRNGYRRVGSNAYDLYYLHASMVPAYLLRNVTRTIAGLVPGARRIVPPGP